MLSVSEFNSKQIVFVFTQSGDKLSFSNENIVIKDKEEQIKHKSSCYKIFMLCVVGGMCITTGLIMKARKYGFSIVLMTSTFRVYQVLNNGAEGNTLLRKKQYDYDSLILGKQIIYNKIINQIDTVKKIRDKKQLVDNTTEILEEHLILLSKENEFYKIMGIEGSAARTYFHMIFSDFDWDARRPRIKNDYINSTLDLGYTILFNFIESILSLYGFDLYYGIFHKQFYKRKSLVCDIMEPIRPLIDWKIRTCINLKQIKIEDFTFMDNKCCLKYENYPKYIDFFTKCLLEKKEKIFRYIQSYYRNFSRNEKKYEQIGLS